MSKKKSFSGSTMTLRDFHGGSIPSDLPLPSAPGMTVERSSHDRPSSGGRLSRGFGSDRGSFLRQGSANMARSFEDKAFYFPNPANIGRNYDEDERKPVDGQSRRGAAVETFEEQLHSQSQASYVRPADRYSVENRASYSSPKYDVGADSYAHEDFGLIPVGHSAKLPQDYHQAASMYTQDLHQSAIASQEQPGYQPVQSSRPYSSQQPVESVSPWRQGNMMSPKPISLGAAASPGAGVQNIWTARREGELNRSLSNEMSGNDVVGGFRTQTVASRIAQASALEKVSSGRWNSRVPCSPVEQPHENTGEYSQVQRHPIGGSRVDIAGDNSIHARHSADLGPSVYSDNNSSSYSEYARAGYTEAVRGFDAGSSRSIVRSSSMQGSFSDNRYGELVSRAFPEPTNEWADGSTRYQEASKPSPRDYKVERHAEDIPVHSHGDIGRRGNFGVKDMSWAVVAEVVSYPESGRPKTIRYGSSEAGMYGEPGDFIQTSSSPQARGVYGDGRIVDGNKGIVPEHGRQGYSILEQGGNVDSGYGHYPHDSLGVHRGEGPRGSQTVFPYGSEEVSQQSHGRTSSREFLVRDGSRSPYVTESPKDVYVNERTKVTSTAEIEGGRVQYPRVVRSNSSVNEMGTPTSAFSSAASMESDGKNFSAERPKLKLLPRSKPLEVESGNGFLQEDSGNNQVELEIVQSLSTEFPLSTSSGTAAANISASPRPTDDELIGRPKLNLKPRSQISDVLPDSRSVKERMSVFGGARPRELVLKERGVEESSFAGVEIAPSPGTFISGSQRPTSGGNRYVEEPEYRGDRADEWRVDARRLELHDIGNGRQIARHDSGRLERNESRGRKEPWFDSDRREDRRTPDSRQVQEKRDVERPDVDKQESWRHNTEFQSPSYGQTSTPLSGSSGGGELHSRGPGRIGIASAAELAQAFSRSTSLGSGSTRGYLGSQISPAPRTPGSGFAESSLDSPKDARFSRLTETAPRDVHISGAQGSSRRMNAY